MKNGESSVKLNERAGLLSTGPDGTNFNAEWPWQTLPEDYLNNCQEPWAGHYSGSIVELLFMIDLFTRDSKIVGGDSPFKSFRKQSRRDFFKDPFSFIRSPFKFFTSRRRLNAKVRRCKAALSAAFLLSIGYHAAIEVKPTIWAYLGRGNIGENPKIFSMKNQVCDVHATDDIVNLMRECTENDD